MANKTLREQLLEEVRLGACLPSFTCLAIPKFLETEAAHIILVVTLVQGFVTGSNMANFKICSAFMAKHSSHAFALEFSNFSSINGLKPSALTVTRGRSSCCQACDRWMEQAKPGKPCLCTDDGQKHSLG
nr:hypothetical protein CFP56_00813 [Quercus suber]